MKHISIILLVMIMLTGCSLLEEYVGEEDQGELETAFKQDTGEGVLELVTPTITTADEIVEIKVSGIDEDKITFISVANESVFEGTMENDKVYKLDISGIEGAFPTDYKPKLQLLQTSDDKESGDIITFKQVRYTVEQK
ncbi:hypothetical protein [Gracilibacillus alcaliphilus]|uniref:hypothetical protein n=1 Tax=Gracilibacillus alcaliphilus TaxID=1401441 RepID=UPI0019562468|nr:hypothetical protein [Gracilibacillus alcaliphilus]MBM7677382.1 PBP1b-binding outer membrane lipoprotein LpoB [Gracilibacillus alcaliphilus]